MPEKTVENNIDPANQPKQPTPNSKAEENNGEEKDHIKKDERQQVMDTYRERINKLGSDM